MDNHFIIIKDSLLAEAEVLKYSSDYDEILDFLLLILKEENFKREVKNKRPDSIMERKHPGFKGSLPMVLLVESKKENEKIRYSDGRVNFRIERVG